METAGSNSQQPRSSRGEFNGPANTAWGTERRDRTGAIFPRVALKDFLEDEVQPPPGMRAQQKKEEKMDIITFDELQVRLSPFAIRGAYQRPYKDVKNEIFHITPTR